VTRYRIKPYGDRSWLVQERWLFLWLDCTINTGPDYYERVTFGTEAEAEKWIDRQIKASIAYERMKRDTWRRSHRHLPREYPDRALNPKGGDNGEA
jgi:hypothetical protein